MKIRNKEKSSVLTGVKPILFGTIVSVVVSLLCVALTAFLVGKGSLGVNAVDVCTKIIVAIASFAGCTVCVISVQEKIMMYSGICAAAYFFLLAATNILAFSGKFKGMLWTIVVILAAAALSALIRSKMLQQKGSRKFRF